ncbi:MAG: PIN domain-containing protein [Armatimonadetes bacterium]|nr:PIN domain-containing protein [Armatimonadota bacterium]
MRGPIFLDTSGLYALADVSDAHHLQAKSIVASLKRSKRKILTTNYVLVETHALLLARLGHSMARGWLRTFNAPVENCEHEDLKLAKEIIFSREDKSFSLADAVSFVVMERLRSKEVFAFDVHFEQYGFCCVRADLS